MTEKNFTAGPPVGAVSLLIHRIGAIRIGDYSKVKSLYLPANATDSSAKSFFDNATGAVYIVPTGKVFIGGMVSYWIDHKDTAGRIGEGTALNGQISREQMGFGDGTTFPGSVDQLGVFRTGKYVNAESSNGFSLKVPTFLYGIEIEETPEVTVQFDIGGYISTDYTNLRVLTLPGTATNTTRKTFHDVRTGGDYSVPSGKVFIAGQIEYWINYAGTMAKIGWSTNPDENPTRDIFSCGLGTDTIRTQRVFGIFPSDKYITAEGSDGFGIRQPCYLFGAEIDSA